MTDFDLGLDLSRPDEMTTTEWEEFSRLRGAGTGIPSGIFPTMELFVPFRPDLVKRWRILNRALNHDDRGQTGDMFLANLHYYAVIGFDDGVLYAATQAAGRGHPRAAIVSTLAIAFLHAPSVGLHTVGPRLSEMLHHYPEPSAEDLYHWPDAWTVDPEAFAVGLDPTTPELTRTDRERIEGWYEKLIGEVPGHVRLLADLAPRVLKAQRARYETAVGTGLPKQCLPFYQLHLDVHRGFAEGIRENLLLAKAFGMTKAQVVQPITYGLMYGGQSALSTVEHAVGDLLRSWDE